MGSVDTADFRVIVATVELQAPVVAADIQATVDSRVIVDTVGSVDTADFRVIVATVVSQE